MYLSFLSIKKVYHISGILSTIYRTLSIASLNRLIASSLPRTSAISNGPGEFSWPESATRSGHNTDPLENPFSIILQFFQPPILSLQQFFSKYLLIP